MWQESLASTDVSEMDTDREVEEEEEEESQIPHSYSISSNDFSSSSLEMTPRKSNNKYSSNKHELRSDSSGCGMSSTRVSKENTLVSGINMMIVDNHKLGSPSSVYGTEMAVIPHTSTPIKNIGHDTCSSRTKDVAALLLVSNKQNNESQKRRSSKKHKRTVSHSFFITFF